MKLRILLSIILAITTVHTSYAEDAAPAAAAQPAVTEAAKKEAADKEKTQKVIADYKHFLATVPAPVREEIRTYRKAVMQINKEKINLYKKLSQEAQGILTNERKFKSQLPIKDRREISKDFRE